MATYMLLEYYFGGGFATFTYLGILFICAVSGYFYILSLLHNDCSLLLFRTFLLQYYDTIFTVG